ncbi:hypothetical protein V1478_001898 [Vespula squamosa]|uniref:Uncharacterized protein n=1 Tax=Vespula squamosa TaxID=30214 RepID=A0ABD2BYG0_VESSQ
MLLNIWKFLVYRTDYSGEKNCCINNSLLILRLVTVHCYRSHDVKCNFSMNGYLFVQQQRDH